MIHFATSKILQVVAAYRLHLQGWCKLGTKLFFSLTIIISANMDPKGDPIATMSKYLLSFMASLVLINQIKYVELATTPSIRPNSRNESKQELGIGS